MGPVNDIRRRRGSAPPAEIRESCRELVERCGGSRAAKRLGISRDALMALAGGLPVQAGTIALARERLAALPAIVALGHERASASERDAS
jgi:hypothetical protein